MTTANLPQWQRTSTVAISILSAISTLLGLFRSGQYPPELLPGFYIQDALILGIGVPALLIGLIYTMRGSLRGRILWLGALSYMTYMWASIALQVSFNRFYLGYIVLFGLSAYTLIGGLVDTDQTKLSAQMEPRLSERLYGAFLWFIGLGLAFLWLSELVPATVSGVPPLLVMEVGPQALASHFIDLSVVVPALIISGYLLWKRRAWGYVFGGVALVFGALLAPTLTGMTVVLLLGESVSVPAVAAILTILPAVIAAILALRFVLSISGHVDLESQSVEKPRSA